MAYKYTTVIEFNDTDMYVLRLQHRGSKHVIQKFDAVPTTSSNEKDATALLARLVNVKSLNAKTHRVIVLLPRRQVLFRYLVLPSKNPREISRMVSLQLGNLIPYSIDEVICHHNIINLQEDGYSKVLCLCVEKKASMRCLRVLKGLGIEPSMLTLGALGFSHYLNYPQVSLSDTNLFINCDTKVIDLVFYHAGKLAYARALRFGFSNDKQTIEMLINQLELTITSFQKEAIDAQRINYFLIGDGDQLHTTKEALDVWASSSSQILDVSTMPSVQIKSKALEGGINPALPVSCIGAAAVTDDKLLNFIPENILTLTRRRRQVRAWVRIAVMFLGICVLGFSGFYAQISKKKQYLTELKEQFSVAQNKVKDMQGIKQRVSFVQNKLDETTFIADVMHDFHNFFPEKSTLTLFNITRKKSLVIQGFTFGADDVSALQKSMVDSPFFTNVTLDFVNSRKTRDGNATYFQISSQLKGKAGD